MNPAAFGKYRVVELLGEGGMGQVYLAEDPELRRRVAVKVLHAHLAAQPELVARFLNEARAAASVPHPAFVGIFDWGRTEAGAPYFAMECLQGRSLDRRIAAGPLAIEEAVRIGEEAAAALAAAHGRGIVHRDIKPANLFLATDAGAPGGARLKILDFGIARVSADLAATGTGTKTGQLLGTPAYMSPEQCLGRKDVDHRADIYSMGAVLFEMVCGRPPFQAQGFGEILNMQINVAAPAASTLRRDLPPELDELIRRALAKRPEDRPQAMTEVATSLADVRARLRRGVAPTMAGDAALVDGATEKTAPSGGPGEPAPRAGGAGPASGATVPPVFVSSSTSPPARPLRRSAAWLAAVLGVGLAAGALVLARSFARPVAAGAAPATVPPGTSPQPSPPSPSEPPAAPGAQARRPSMTINLETVPAGAWVKTVPGDEDLGTTPLSLERPDGQELSVRIGSPGFRTAVHAMRFDSDRTERVSLAPDAAKPREGKAGQVYLPPEKL